MNFNLFSKASLSKISKLDFSSPNVCSEVDNMLMSNPADKTTCEESLKSITILASNIQNRTKFISLGTPVHVIKIIRAHLNTSILVEWGLRALTNLSIDSRSIDMMLQNDMCPTIASIISTYSKIDIILEESCKIIYNISEENDNSKDLFTRFGTLQTLSVMIFIENHVLLKSTTLEHILRAIGSLARRNNDNKEYLHTYGFVHQIIPIAKGLEIKEDSFIEAVCWVIGNITYPNETNQHILNEAGACEYILNILSNHLDNSMLIQETFRAIRNLCHIDELNLLKLEGLDVCNILVNAILFQIQKGIHIQAIQESLHEKIMKLGSKQSLLSVSSSTMTSFLSSSNTFLQGVVTTNFNLSSSSSSSTNNEIPMSETEMKIQSVRGAVQWGWYALASLAELDSTLQAFRTTNLIEIIKLSLERYGVLEECAQWTCHAISKLAQDHHLSTAIGNYTMNILQSLVQILRVHLTACDVIEECLHAIGTLCQLDSNKQLFSKFDLEIYAIHGLQHHLSSEEVCEAGCYVIHQLCQHQTHTPSIIEKLTQSGITKLLPKVMIKYSNNARIAEYCCSALISIASNDVINRKLGKASASAAIVAVIEANLTDIHIVSLALKSIVKLNEYEGNIANLRNDGVCAAVGNALHVNTHNSAELCKFCLEVIASLARDDVCRQKFIEENYVIQDIVISLSVYVEDRSMIVAGFSALSGVCGVVTDTSHEDNLLSSDTDMLSSTTTTTGMNSMSNNSNTDLSSALNPIYHIENIQAKLVSMNLMKATDTRTILCQKLNESRIYDIIYQLLYANKQYDDICLSACSAITSIAEYSELRRKLLPCYELLVDILKTYATSAALVNIACLAIGSLSKDDNTLESQNILNSLGINALIISLFEKYMDSSDICSSICRTITNISYSHTINKSQLIESNVMSLLETCLRKHISNEKCTRYAVCAIAELNIDYNMNSYDITLSSNTTTSNHNQIMAQSATSAAVNYELLTNLGKLIIEAIEKYIHSIIIVQTGCMAIVSMKHMNIELGRSKACEMVVTILIKYNQSEMVTQWCLRAIGSLANCLENRHTFRDTNICELICSSLHYHIGNESILSVMLMRTTSSVYVAQYGCDAIYYLTRSQIDASFYQIKFANCNACEYISKALQKYKEIDIVACACIRAIVVLSKGNPANAIKFGYLGCCSSILECLNLFPASPEVAMWGCRGVSMLSQDIYNNISRLVAAGVCETIPVSMQAHQMNPGVAGSGSESIAAILDACPSEEELLGLASRLGRSGGCEALISVLKNHRDQPVVIEKACKAVTSMAKVHGNSGWFGATGCLEAILTAQSKHAENYIVSSSSWEALGSLCIDENNRSKLIQYNTCELVLDSFYLHIHFVEMAYAGAYAIEKLSENKDEKFRKMKRYELPTSSSSSSSSATSRLPSSDQLHILESHETYNDKDSNHTEDNTEIPAINKTTSGDIQLKNSAKGTLSTTTTITTSSSNKVTYSGMLTDRSSFNQCVINLNDADIDNNTTTILDVIDEGSNDNHSTTTSPSRRNDTSSSSRRSILTTAAAAAAAGGGSGSELLVSHKTSGSNDLSAPVHIPMNTLTTSSKSGSVTPTATIDLDDQHMKTIQTPTRPLSVEVPLHTMTSSSPSSHENLTTLLHSQSSFIIPNNNTTTTTTNTNSSNETVSYIYIRSKDTAKGRFFKGGCHSILLNALTIHYPDAKVVCQICRTIAKLSSGYGGNKHPDRIAFGYYHGCETVIKAIQYHIKHEHVIRWSTLAISELIKDNKVNKTALQQCGGLESLVHILKTYYTTQTPLYALIIEATAISIYHMTLKNIIHRQILGKTECIEMLLKAIDCHQKSMETTYACNISLFQVCYGIEYNIKQLYKNNGTDILVTILNKYYDVKNIVAATLSSLSLLNCVYIYIQANKLHKIHNTSIEKVLPLLWQRYEKNDFINILICTLITSTCYKSLKNKTFLGQTSILKSLLVMIERKLSQLCLDTQVSTNFVQLQSSGHMNNTILSNVQFLDNFLFDTKESKESTEYSMKSMNMITTPSLNPSVKKLSNSSTTITTDNTTDNNDNNNNNNNMNHNQTSIISSTNDSLSHQQPAATTNTTAITTTAPAAAEWKEFPADVDTTTTSNNNNNHNNNSTSVDSVDKRQSMIISGGNRLSMNKGDRTLITTLINDVFSPPHIHTSLTGCDSLGIYSSYQTLNIDYMTYCNHHISEEDLLFEEGLRAFGAMIIDCEINKTRISSMNPQFLDILRPYTQCNIDMYYIQIRQLMIELTNAGTMTTLNSQEYYDKLNILLHNQYISRILVLLKEIYKHLVPK